MQVATQGAKIIVFPECGVTGRIYCTNCREAVRAYAEDIPDVIPGTATIQPCTDSAFDDRPILRALSCIARKHSIALVVNMIDDKNDLLLNSDVIFGPDGTIIAKYYKQHLFGLETSVFNTPPLNRNRHTAFSTSFGVNFSVFICYDILFCDPPLAMIEKGLKIFVYSSYLLGK